MAKREQENKKAKVEPEAKGFTGLARSVICSTTHGRFKNFRIVTLAIENGVVVSQTVSDAYANFETISRLELLNEKSIMHLNSKYEDGLTLRI